MSQDRDSLGERLVGDGSEGSPGGTQLNNSSPPISPPKNQVGAIAGPRTISANNISIDRFIGLYAYICVYVYT